MNTAVETLTFRLEQLRNSVENEQRYQEQHLRGASACKQTQEQLLVKIADVESALEKLKE